MMIGCVFKKRLLSALILRCVIISFRNAKKSIAIIPIFLISIKVFSIPSVTFSIHTVRPVVQPCEKQSFSRTLPKTFVVFALVCSILFQSDDLQRTFWFWKSQLKKICERHGLPQEECNSWPKVSGSSRLFEFEHRRGGEANRLTSIVLVVSGARQHRKRLKILISSSVDRWWMPRWWKSQSASIIFMFSWSTFFGLGETGHLRCDDWRLMVSGYTRELEFPRRQWIFWVKIGPNLVDRASLFTKNER